MYKRVGFSKSFQDTVIPIVSDNISDATTWYINE